MKKKSEFQKIDPCRPGSHIALVLIYTIMKNKKHQHFKGGIEVIQTVFEVCTYGRKCVATLQSV